MSTNYRIKESEYQLDFDQFKKDAPKHGFTPVEYKGNSPDYQAYQLGNGHFIHAFRDSYENNNNNVGFTKFGSNNVDEYLDEFANSINGIAVSEHDDNFHEDNEGIDDDMNEEISTSELINKHKKNSVSKILEWMDYNDLTNDAKVLIMCAIAKSAKTAEHNTVHDYLMTESKLIKGEEISPNSIWESLELSKNQELNEDQLNHYIGLAKKKFNELIKVSPLSPDNNYALDMFNAMMAEGKITNSERRELVKSFILGNNEVVVEDYNSGIKKLVGVARKINEETPFDFELTSTIYMEDNRINETFGDEVEDHATKAKREKEQEKESEKNKKEFADNNVAKAKNTNAPLAKALRAQGVSQDDAADMLDVDKSTISRIKSGVRKPSFELLQKMSGKFGSIDSLFPELT